MIFQSFQSRLFAAAVLATTALPVGPAHPARAQATTQGLPGPSFTCPGGTQVEVTICSDPKLSAEDRRMTGLYDLSHPAAFGHAPSGELAAQRAWLKRRDTCAQRPRDELQSCIEGYYHDRLVALARAVLFTDPDRAFQVLHQVEPQTEPIYRAMYLYATIDDPKRRTQAVAPLIKPLYDRHNGYATIQAPTVSDVVASDENFGGFIAETWTHVGDYPPIVWPCGVLSRRPGLIAALGSRYGGAIDGAIPGADCDETAPAIVGMDDLIQAAWNATPACDGTIRFSTGRDYEKLKVAIRLHQPFVWAKYPVQKPEAEERIFRTTTAAYIHQVTGTLATYYGKTFAVAPDTARRDAAGAVDHLINDAFTVCD